MILINLAAFYWHGFWQKRLNPAAPDAEGIRKYALKMADITRRLA